jgi:hypothetical protein
MVRGGLDAAAPAATLVLEGNGGVVFLARSASGATTRTIASSNQNAPVWLKLTRTGSTIAAFVSATGTTWTQIGSATIGLPGSSYVGLAVTSHTTAATTTATFDNVGASTLP